MTKHCEDLLLLFSSPSSVVPALAPFYRPYSGDTFPHPPSLPARPVFFSFLSDRSLLSDCPPAFLLPFHLLVHTHARGIGLERGRVGRREGGREGQRAENGSEWSASGRTSYLLATEMRHRRRGGGSDRRGQDVGGRPRRGKASRKGRSGGREGRGG